MTEQGTRGGTSRPAWGSLDAATEAILERINGNDRYTDDRFEVVRAVLYVADQHDGRVSLNDVRLCLRHLRHPFVVGPTIQSLCRRGVLGVAGWEISDDSKGRNKGKPQRVYRYIA